MNDSSQTRVMTNVNKTKQQQKNRLGYLKVAFGLMALQTCTPLTFAFSAFIVSDEGKSRKSFGTHEIYQVLVVFILKLFHSTQTLWS